MMDSSTPTARRRASNETIRDFHDQLFLAGLKDEYSERGPWSGYLALDQGMPVGVILDCLQRQRPEMFDGTLARKRQAKLARQRNAPSRSRR
jgi:hypothetical protein